MARRKRGFFGRLIRLSMFAGAAYAVWKAIEANRSEQDGSWESQPFPFPPQPRSDDPSHDDPGTSAAG